METNMFQTTNQKPFRKYESYFNGFEWLSFFRGVRPVVRAREVRAISIECRLVGHQLVTLTCRIIIWNSEENICWFGCRYVSTLFIPETSVNWCDASQNKIDNTNAVATTTYVWRLHTSLAASSSAVCPSLRRHTFSFLQMHHTLYLTQTTSQTTSRVVFQVFPSFQSCTFFNIFDLMSEVQLHKFTSFLPLSGAHGTLW
jgi:hypothetical protein